MTSPAKCGAWLLPLLLSGCILHRPRESRNLPYAPPVEVPTTIQVASLELPPTVTVIPARPIYNMREPTYPVKPPVKHRILPGKNADEGGNPETVAAAPVSAIGQLSSGAPGDFRQQTEGAIAAIERELNGINRTLDDTEQKTADNIREDLKQAKTALSSGDVDGAHTLAAKAKALLDELSK
jgi:hypothetical protein